jgi:protein ImuA
MYNPTMTAFEFHFPPMNTRTHEVCGPSAYAFAFALAGRVCRTGADTVLWVREAWNGTQLNPLGFAPYLDPQQLLIAQAPSHSDALASAEEALRSGRIPLVVMDLSQPIGLTEGRRLQLAAQQGGAMGLCILPEGMGSNAAQTRWHCAPVFDAKARADSTLQKWEIIKNKTGTQKAWNVKWDAQTCRINVVSEAAQR